MPAPPKPWEQKSATEVASPLSASSNSAPEAAPALPEQPASLRSGMDATTTGVYLCKMIVLTS